MLNFFKTSGATNQKPFELEPLRRNQNIITRFDSKLNVMKLHRPDFECLMCLQKTPSCRFVKVANSFIIQLYGDHRSRFRALLVKHKNNMTPDIPFQPERDTIPNYFRNLLESVNSTSYQALSSSAAFCKELNMICMDCFLLGATKVDTQLKQTARESASHNIQQPVKVFLQPRIFLNPKQRTNDSLQTPQIPDISARSTDSLLAKTEAQRSLPKLSVSTGLRESESAASIRAPTNPGRLYNMVKGRVTELNYKVLPAARFKLGSFSSRTTKASPWSSQLVSTDQTIDKLYLTHG